MLPEERKRTAHKAVVTRVLEGDGRASSAQRRAAFENAELAEPLEALAEAMTDEKGSEHASEDP
jgi:hypothetical protein